MPAEQGLPVLYSFRSCQYAMQGQSGPAWRTGWWWSFEKWP